jgi:hypothetical protein
MYIVCLFETILIWQECGGMWMVTQQSWEYEKRYFLRKINLTFKTTFVVSWLKLLSRPLAIYSL